MMHHHLAPSARGPRRASPPRRPAKSVRGHPMRAGGARRMARRRHRPSCRHVGAPARRPVGGARLDVVGAAARGLRGTGPAARPAPRPPAATPAVGVAGDVGQHVAHATTPAAGWAGVPLVGQISRCPRQQYALRPRHTPRPKLAWLHRPPSRGGMVDCPSSMSAMTARMNSSASSVMPPATPP